jgi:hypothetical protein
MENFFSRVFQRPAKSGNDDSMSNGGLSVCTSSTASEIPDLLDDLEDHHFKAVSSVYVACHGGDTSTVTARQTRPTVDFEGTLTSTIYIRNTQEGVTASRRLSRKK